MLLASNSLSYAHNHFLQKELLSYPFQWHEHFQSNKNLFQLFIYKVYFSSSWSGKNCGQKVMEGKKVLFQKPLWFNNSLFLTEFDIEVPKNVLQALKNVLAAKNIPTVTKLGTTGLVDITTYLSITIFLLLIYLFNTQLPLKPLFFYFSTIHRMAQNF